jgi:hypothetical protein
MGILEEANKKKDYASPSGHAGVCMLCGYVLSFGWYHNAGRITACMKKRNAMLYDT